MLGFAVHLTILGLVDCPISLHFFRLKRAPSSEPCGLFSYRPFRAPATRGYPGFRFAARWATILRRFAA